MPSVSLTPWRARLGCVPLLLLMGAAACATSPGPSPSMGTSDEAKLMESLRQREKTSPAAALAEADAADARYGESPFVEERRALAIQALVDLQRIGEARTRAYRFLESYPNGPFTAQVQALTGVHPPPAMGRAK